jgi:Acyl-CoA dehydrogenase, C-terminal domain
MMSEMVILDRLGATVLVIPSETDDAVLWEKANAVIDRVPSLQQVLVVGGEDDLGRKIVGFDESLSAQSSTPADKEMELHACRLAVWHAAWLLDEGGEARTVTSQCKVFCSEALSRVVDRPLRVLGGLGITSDTVVMRIYKEIRPFRIYDGPSEVHRWALARQIMKRN